MSQITDQDQVIVVQKKCAACNQTKPITDFRRQNAEKVRPRCKECEKNIQIAKIKEVENDIVRKVERDWYAMWIG